MLERGDQADLTELTSPRDSPTSSAPPTDKGDDLRPLLSVAEDAPSASDDAANHDESAAAAEANTSSPASAASRVLRIPEIVAAILAHLLPRDEFGTFDAAADDNDDDNDDNDDGGDGSRKYWRYDDDEHGPYVYAEAVTAVAEAIAAAASTSATAEEAAAAAAAAGASAGMAPLRSAARVNSTWFAAAVPLLWRRPSQHAFGAAAAAGMEPARRDFYAAHIREVYIARRCGLWLALASVGGGSGDSVADSPSDSGHLGGPSVPDSGSRGGLRLPRLTALHLPLKWLEDMKLGRDSQLAAQHHIGAHLTELSCFLSADLLERLGATSPAESQPPMRVRLRKLMLYGRAQDSIDADGGEVEARLLAWLAAQQLSGSAAPALTSLRFVSVFCAAAGALADAAFVQFARRAGLRQLWLGDTGPELVEPVSPLAVADIAKAAVTHDEGGGRNQDHTVGELPPQPPPPSAVFSTLTDLAVTLRLGAVRPLAPLLTSVTCLSVDVPYDDEDGTSDPVGDSSSLDAAASVFGPLATLTQLRHLRLVLSYSPKISRAAWLSLRSLTQLRDLLVDGSTSAGGADDDVIDDADLATVLQAMPRLRSLEFPFSHRLSNVLCVIGASCRMLRRLTLRWICYISRQLAHAAPQPLFPCLELFSTFTVNRTSEEVDSDLPEEQLAEQHARLLHAHAPRLKKLALTFTSTAYSRQVQHTLLQLTQGDGGCTPD